MTHFLRGGQSLGTGAYAAGQTFAMGFAVLLVVVGLYCLVQPASPKN